MPSTMYQAFTETAVHEPVTITAPEYPTYREWDGFTEQLVVWSESGATAVAAPLQLLWFGGEIGTTVIGTAFFQAIQLLTLTQGAQGSLNASPGQTFALTQTATGNVGTSVSTALPLAQSVQVVYAARGTAAQSLELTQLAATGVTATQVVALGQSAAATVSAFAVQPILVTQNADGVVALSVLQNVSLSGSVVARYAARANPVRSLSLGHVAYIPGTRIWGALESDVEILTGDYVVHFSE